MYKSIRGMEDILPGGIRAWQSLERIARIELESNGYSEIRTPILEETAVFSRSIGDTTDIVTKEMYTFVDKKGRGLSLRPEGTAPIVRAYVEHSLHRISNQSRLYYIGPMFRSERPQKGRSRQFHQIGAEIIGSSEPQMDAEIIARLSDLLKLFGLEAFQIKLNSLGCKDDKDKFSGKLKNYLKGKKNKLCADCNNRLEKNCLRVLDCKNEECVKIVKDSPDIADNLCGRCGEHFGKVKMMLESYFGVQFVESKKMVRGLDYYTGTVFEVTHPDLGGQDALGGGGRYDNLVKEFGGPNVGAVGFAIGIERVFIALGDKKDLFGSPGLVYIATLGGDAKIKGRKLAEELRLRWNGFPPPDGRLYNLNVVTLLDWTDASLRSQMRSADRNGARVVIILGDDEIKQNKAAIKDMENKEPQFLIDIGSVVDEVGKRMGLC
ncbi:MAG: histidine--tRNA ligase [Candidatus Omnitrophota bacterium]|nr:histidine--tRNA ligase [Candidatus Omnitrophota bacterium]